MSNQAISAFAEALVQLVRDRAIRGCCVFVDSGAKSSFGRRWREVLKDADLNQVKDVIIPDCVDDAIFYLLHAIDNGELRLTFTAPDGEKADLTEDGLGELAGWYVGEESWRQLFSNEKISEY
jgi:hypothetical protein